jgi:NifB/MoaA-like Fe-S oxidoreductase
MKQLEGVSLNQHLLIPDVMLRTGEEVFLDDLTVSDLEQHFKKKILVTPVEGQAFLDKILGRS